MEVPLVEHGSLMLRAAHTGAVMPNMALVTRFAETVPREDLEQEAARLASSPFGLGRKLRRPRIPGARPRWHEAPAAPPVGISDDAIGRSGFATWLDDQMSVRHDPVGGPGWQLSAAYLPGGGTVVTLGMTHLFGTGRDVATTLYGGLPDVDLSTLPPGRHWLVDEALDAAGRIWRGLRGVERLGSDVVRLPWRRDPDSDLSTLRLPLEAWRDHDPSRGRSSLRRVAAIATIATEKWNARAAEAGGTTTSFQAALTANLARTARLLRGGDTRRPIRMIVPVDLADRDELPDAAATVGPIRLTSATVVLPGGRATHGDLGDVRAETRRAFGEASAQVSRTGRVPVAPGLIDAMNLLPDDLARRVVFGVHGHYDAAASNVGPMPSTILKLGPWTATDAVLVAFPMGSDVSVTLSRHGDVVQLGAVADPSRLGSGPPLRDRLAAELEAWALSADVWG